MPRWDLILLRNVMIYFDTPIKKMILDRAARLLEVHVCQRRVVGAAGCDHDVVDRRVEMLEEGIEGSGVLGVEDRGAACVKILRGRLQGLGVATSEDDIGSLCTRASGGRQPDARAAADYDDGLSEKLGRSLGGNGCSCGDHASSCG